MKNTGFYIGAVVQNNDPLKMGRIKVFVPHISATVYTNWNALSADKDFSELGSNENQSISNIIDTVKDILPWANPASPIVGESGHSYYNAFENLTGIGDGNSSKQGLEIYGDKLAKFFEDSPLEDAYSNTFSPVSYSSLPKGSFSIPKVGSHVWVFFHNGDVQFPVYFAIAHGGEFSQMYGDADYPDKFENYSSRDSEEYNDEYKNKWVLNQRGATIEVNNSDGQESITISHYDGSFKQMLKDIVKEFIQKDEIRLVNNDQLETINNNRKQTIKNINTEYVGLSSGRIVEDDDAETIGGDRKLIVNKGEIINISENTDKNIGEDYILTIGTNKTENVGNTYSLTIGDGGLIITSSGDISITAPNVSISGDTTIEGTTIIKGQTTIQDGSILLNGNVTIDPSKTTTINGTKVGFD